MPAVERQDLDSVATTPQQCDLIADDYDVPSEKIRMLSQNTFQPCATLMELSMDCIISGFGGPARAPRATYRPKPAISPLLD